MKFIKRTNRVIFEKTSSIHDQMRRKIDEEKVKKKGKGVFAAKEMDGRRQNTENRSQLSPSFRSSLSINRQRYLSIDRSGQSPFDEWGFRSFTREDRGRQERKRIDIDINVVCIRCCVTKNPIPPVNNYKNVFLFPFFFFFSIR